MRVLAVVAAVVAVVAVTAAPLEQDEVNESSGSRTWVALKDWFRPVKDYFQKTLPEQTPGDVAADVKDTVQDVKQWASENDAIQTLLSALRPVNDWVKDKAEVLKDKTFREMYEDVKGKVQNLDEKVGAWIQRKTQGDPEILH